MNIIEYLQAVLPINQIWPGIRNNPGAQIAQLSKIEMEIREGIAQELEQLVLKGEPVRVHGVPITAWPKDGAEARQNVMRGAANCVRGKDPVGEDDWGRQTERMHAMAELRDLQRGDREPFPMPTDAQLQLKFEQDEERKREWND